MGIFSEYLDKNLDWDGLQKERKTQLKRISELRGGRAVMTYAAAIGSPIKGYFNINIKDFIRFF
jgi:hypothetical protein